ncbi:MAG TPA: response regulator transcription factor [Hyphomicrobiaceae bacterium]|nr:response regulator transcription factor [Hyphomicrobiaceae bacterium]
MMRVLLVDDHPIVRQGCRRILEDACVCEVIEAESVEAGFRLFRQRRPDVAIVDLALQGKGLGGLDLIRRLRAEAAQVPILVLSMHGDPIIVSRAMAAGATGYLLKDSPPESLIEAFESVRRGNPYLSHQLALQVALLGTPGRNEQLAELTRRELQTLALVAEGKSYEEIARALGVSYKTVANTCSQLKAKLGARTLPELVRMAIEYISSSSQCARVAVSDGK